jgi:hypothetical protein
VATTDAFGLQQGAVTDPVDRETPVVFEKGQVCSFLGWRRITVTKKCSSSILLAPAAHAASLLVPYQYIFYIKVVLDYSLKFIYFMPTAKNIKVGFGLT